MFEEEREITPELLTELSNTLIRKSDEVINIILELMSLKDAIRKKLEEIGVLRKITDSVDEKIIGYAIDSSFAQVLPLVAGDFFVVTAGYIRYPRIHTFRKEENAGLKVGVRLLHTMTPSMRAISAYAHIIERKIALELLRQDWKFNTILIDGPILPLYILYIPKRNLYDEEKKLIEITEELVKTSKEKEVSIIGIVKRIRSRFIPRGFRSVLENVLGNKYSKLLKISNDKSLGSLVLLRSEAIFFGKIGESKSAYDAVVGEEGFKRFADEFISDHPWLKEMELAIVKPKRSRQVISVEALDYANLSFKDILMWVNAHATNTGCPQILDYVDSYVQITSGLIEIARKLLIKIIADKIRQSGEFKEYEIIELLLDYADLQKKYAPRMG